MIYPVESCGRTDPSFATVMTVITTAALAVLGLGLVKLIAPQRLCFSRRAATIMLTTGAVAATFTVALACLACRRRREARIQHDPYQFERNGTILTMASRNFELRRDEMSLQQGQYRDLTATTSVTACVAYTIESRGTTTLMQSFLNFVPRGRSQEELCTLAFEELKKIVFLEQ